MRGLLECSVKEPHTHQMVRLYGGNEVGVMSVYINGWICIFVFRSSLTKTQKRLFFFFFFFFPICVYFRCIYLIYILSTTLVENTHHFSIYSGLHSTINVGERRRISKSTTIIIVRCGVLQVHLKISTRVSIMEPRKSLSRPFPIYVYVTIKPRERKQLCNNPERRNIISTMKFYRPHN